MKFIATKDFRNVPGLELEIDKALHPSHIHKGALFEIGKGAELKDCSKTDQQTIAQLIVAGCVGDATDEKIVKAVKADVALDEKREKAAAAANSAANDSVLVQQLIAMLKSAKPA
jgi:hypothetical protein